MERLLRVEFGPSRSQRFAQAVALAESGPGECRELEPGRYRVSFLLGSEAATYAGLGRLLEHVRHWRATEVYEGREQVSAFQAKEMAWCASFYLDWFGDCREPFALGVLPRCALCPLFDAERAIRAGLREEPVPGQPVPIGSGENAPEFGPEPDGTIVRDLDFLFNPELLAQLDWQLPDWMDLSALIPDFPPEEREGPRPEEPAA